VWALVRDNKELQHAAANAAIEAKRNAHPQAQYTLGYMYIKGQVLASAFAVFEHNNSFEDVDILEIICYDMRHVSLRFSVIF
jgi:hypothetical protein